MVLNEVDDVVVELLHVGELGHEHVVASTESLVVFRQGSDSDGGVVDVNITSRSRWWSRGEE